MTGAVSTAGKKSTCGQNESGNTALPDAQTDGVRKPVISNIYVRQDDPLNIDKQLGIGFFGTISAASGIFETSDGTEIMGSQDGTFVTNLRLSDVTVDNNTVSTEYDQSVVGALVDVLEGVLSGVTDLLDFLLWLLSFGLVGGKDGALTNVIHNLWKPASWTQRHLPPVHLRAGLRVVLPLPTVKSLMLKFPTWVL